MHQTAYIFATHTLNPEDVRGKRVVEAGAYDYNGSARSYLESLGPASYTGTDAQDGPGVDLVCPAEDLPPLARRGRRPRRLGSVGSFEGGQSIGRVTAGDLDKGLSRGGVLYCQGAAGSGLAAALEAARAGADRLACAVYPIALTLHRVSAEALASAGEEPVD